LWCGGWQALFDYSAGLGCEVRRDAWVEIAGGGLQSPTLDFANAQIRGIEMMLIIVDLFNKIKF